MLTDDKCADRQQTTDRPCYKKCLVIGETACTATSNSVFKKH